MVKALTLVLAVTLATAGATEARMHAPYRGHRIVPAATAPLDAFTQPVGAYSFRKLRSAYAGNAIRLRRASDNAEADIGFLGFVPGLGAPWNEAAAASHCAATTCFARTWYDQSGLARNVEHPTAANQPALIFNCDGSLPCLRNSTATQVLYGPSNAPASPLSLSVVAIRNSGVGNYCGAVGWSSNSLFADAAAATWAIGGTGVMYGTVSEAAWHAMTGVINGAASVFNVDGVETTGTVTVVAGASSPSIPSLNSAAGVVCSFGEVIVWSGYALSPAERVALGDNQKNYWLPAPLDTFTSPSGAYSFRKLKSTYAGPAMKLRRATGGVQDINFLGGTGFTGAPWDQAAATAFCAATTCFLDTWYDQSGLARDIVQASTANQLQLNLSCIGSKPCFQNTVGVSSQTAATIAGYVPAAPVSMSAVSNRSVYGGGSSECLWFRPNTLNRLQTFAGPWYLAAAAAVAAAPEPANAAWHTQEGVINGAASVYNVDGVETTGTVAVDTASGGYVLGTNTATATTCQFAEIIYWSGYALTPAERTFLTSNQRAYITP